MKEIYQALEELCERQPKLLKKGGLSVALVVTRLTQARELPIDFKSLRTPEGGQVIGLGKAAVQNILATHGIKEVLAQEGGRTNRGSLGLMREYVDVLNTLHRRGNLDLSKIESWWIEKVRLQLASSNRSLACGPKLKFDSSESLAANIGNLLAHARNLQSKSKGQNFVGTMLKHLVGAKLDLLLGIGRVHHQSFGFPDQSKGDKGDFQIESVSLHVTANPNEALIRKCGENLNGGLKPIIITTADAMGYVFMELRNCGLSERVDVLDCTQFLTANLYIRSLFILADCKLNFIKLLERYNQIIEECGTTPDLRVNLA